MDNLFHRNTNYFSTCSSISHQSTIRYHTSSENWPLTISPPKCRPSVFPHLLLVTHHLWNLLEPCTWIFHIFRSHAFMKWTTLLFWVPKKLVIFGHPPLGPDQRTTKKGVDAILPGKGSPRLVVTTNTQCMVHFPTCTPYTTELWKKMYQLHWVAGNSEPRIMCWINLYLKSQNPNGKTPTCFNMF